MPQAARKGRPPELDRSAILVAARAAAAERGFDGLRFVDVSRAASVPVSSLQYAFGSRDALVRELLRAGVEGEVHRLEVAMQQGRRPWDRIERFVRASVSADSATRRDGWVLWIELWRAAIRDPEIQNDYVQVARQWRSPVEAAVRDGVSDGTFAPHRGVADATAVIVAIVDGLGLQVEAGDPNMGADRAIELGLGSVASVLGVERP
jgi:AcrR family transcriptional regulator